MSDLDAKGGASYSPGLLRYSNGQALGLRVQKVSKASANFDGIIAIFA